MVKFKSNKNGFVFEAKEGSIHYDILMKTEEFEKVIEKENNENGTLEEENKKKSKKS